MLIKLEDVVSDIKKRQYWYFGNHSKDFITACYIADLLDKMNEDATQADMERMRDDFNNKQDEIKIEAAMFKSMIMVKVYGLLDHSNKVYVKCSPTPVLELIRNRTNGHYTDFDSYVDLYEQQIEKVFFISPFFNTGSKEDFGLYPLMFLYKVIVSIGTETNRYNISQDEFIYFVALARRYENWKDVVETILYYRNKTGGFIVSLKKIMKTENVEPPDQRFCQVIKKNHKLTITDDYLSIKTKYIPDIRSKVAIFEMVDKMPSKQQGSLPHGLKDFRNYVKFLGEDLPLLPKPAKRT